MALTITQQRTLTATFSVKEDGLDVDVKRTQYSFDNEGNSSLVYEEILHPELLHKHRRAIRRDEAELQELRYKIEDEMDMQADED